MRPALVSQAEYTTALITDQGGERASHLKTSLHINLAGVFCASLLVWSGAVLVWSGVFWCGVVRSGVVWFVLVWYDIVWSGMV